MKISAHMSIRPVAGSAMTYGYEPSGSISWPDALYRAVGFAKSAESARIDLFAHAQTRVEPIVPSGGSNT